MDYGSVLLTLAPYFSLIYDDMNRGRQKEWIDDNWEHLECGIMEHHRWNELIDLTLLLFTRGIPIDTHGRVINDSAKSGGGWRRREREWGRED